MGVAGGDYDMDGAFDLLVTNWDTELNALYRNSSSADGVTFDYMTFRVGIAGFGNNKTAWGATWADFDLDTDLDLLVVHGRVPISDPAADAELIRLYGNRTGEGQVGQLRDVSSIVGLDLVGPAMARGSAAADFDNDGDMDVAVNLIAGDVMLLRNDAPARNWLTVIVPEFLPGTVVEVTLPDDTVLLRQWYAGSSYLASEDPRMNFGLGSAETVDVVVRFLDGTSTAYPSVEANQIFVASDR